MPRDTAAPTFEFFAAAPAPPLAAFVESIWAVRGSGTYQRSIVLPNGALQLMVNFGAPHRVVAIRGREADSEHAHVWIAGLQDQPLEIESPRFTDLLSIRFHPGGAHAFLSLPLDALTNEVVGARDVLGTAVDALRESLALARTRREQVQAAETWLLQRLQPREAEFQLVSRALKALADATQPAPVRTVCDQLGLANKRLIRVFENVVGLTPKTTARVLRFHAALRALSTEADARRTELAQRLGYFDQAHFNHEFRRLAGVTPGQFVERQGEDGESLIVR